MRSVQVLALRGISASRSSALPTVAPFSRCPGTRERPVRRFLRRCGLRCVGRFPERLAEEAFFHDPGNCHLGSPLFIQLRQAKSLLYRSRFLHIIDLLIFSDLNYFFKVHKMCTRYRSNLKKTQQNSVQTSVILVKTFQCLLFFVEVKVFPLFRTDDENVSEFHEICRILNLSAKLQ